MPSHFCSLHSAVLFWKTLVSRLQQYWKIPGSGTAGAGFVTASALPEPALAVDTLLGRATFPQKVEPSEQDEDGLLTGEHTLLYT